MDEDSLGETPDERIADAIEALAFPTLYRTRQVGMIQVNVTALTRLTCWLLPDMLKRNRGGVLNGASTAAFQPSPHMSVDYATKGVLFRSIWTKKGVENLPSTRR